MARLSTRQIGDVIRLVRWGMKVSTVAKCFDVHPSTIRRILVQKSRAADVDEAMRLGYDEDGFEHLRGVNTAQTTACHDE